MKENAIIKGSGPDFYKHMSPDSYREKINTPARNEDYFWRYNQPMVERAKLKFGSPIHIIDIACGPADELDYFKDDKDVKFIVTDISPDILPHVRDRLGPQVSAFASDANHPAVKENIAEAGILLNAMIYTPDKMLETMYTALKPGAQCSVNFRIYSLNQNIFRMFNKKAQGQTFNRDLRVQTKTRSKTFSVKVIDFSTAMSKDGSPDIALRQVGQQMYFKSIKDVEELIKMIGFKVIEHSKFEYKSPTKINASVDVLIIEKPESTL